MENTGIKYCSNCGGANPTDGNFCIYCGGELSQNIQSNNIVNQPQTTQQISQQNINNSKPEIKKIKLGFLGIIGLIGTMYLSLTGSQIDYIGVIFLIIYLITIKNRKVNNIFNIIFKISGGFYISLIAFVVIILGTCLGIFVVFS